MLKAPKLEYRSTLPIDRNAAALPLNQTLNELVIDLELAALRFGVLVHKELNDLPQESCPSDRYLQ